MSRYLQSYINDVQKNLAYFTITDSQAQAEFSQTEGETAGRRFSFLIFEILDKNISEDNSISVYVSEDIISNIIENDKIHTIAKENAETIGDLSVNTKIDNYALFKDNSESDKDILKEELKEILKDYKELPTNIGATALLCEAWHTGWHTVKPSTSDPDNYGKRIQGLFLNLTENRDANSILLNMAKNFGLSKPPDQSPYVLGDILTHCNKKWIQDAGNYLKWIEYSLVHQSKIGQLNSFFVHYPLIIDDWFFIGFAYLNSPELTEGNSGNKPEMYDKEKYPKMQAQLDLVAKRIKELRREQVIKEIGKKDDTGILDYNTWLEAVQNYLTCFTIYSFNKSDDEDDEISGFSIKIYKKNEENDAELKIKLPTWIENAPEIWNKVKSEIDEFRKILKRDIFPYHSKKDENKEKNFDNKLLKPILYVIDECSQCQLINEDLDGEQLGIKCPEISSRFNIKGKKFSSDKFREILEDIGRQNGEIAAFMYKDKAGESGYERVKILSRLYPEIPCFIWTQNNSVAVIQDGLASGAAWCFHQKIEDANYNRSNHNIERLTNINLCEHLDDFAFRLFAVPEKLVNPDQFKTHSNLSSVKKLEKALKMSFDNVPEGQTEEEEENSNKIDYFKRLLSSLFASDSLEIVSVLGSGRSSAAATFFISPKSDRLAEATRFVKIGNWLEIQKEYIAYQQVIKPKLNNHIARIIRRPAVIRDLNKLVDPLALNNAAIVSSLAGFPENYDSIRPLQYFFDRNIADPMKTEEITKKITETIEYVICSLQRPTKPEKYSLAIEAPCIYTGELQEYSEDHLPMPETGDKFNILPSDSDQAKYYKLDDWILSDISQDKGETKTFNITLYHPQTYARVRLRANIENYKKYFSALWVRLGMPVCMSFRPDSESNAVTKIAERLSRKAEDLRLTNLDNLIAQHWHKHPLYPNQMNRSNFHPVNFFKNGDTVMNSPWIESGKFATIHGDLNLNNILYPTGSDVGFLIDFSESKLEGIAAFDLAWLEAQIWNHYLFSNLIELVKFSEKAVGTEEINLLFLTLEFMNNTANPNEVFSTRCGITSQSTAKTCVENVLKITYEVRKFFTDSLGLEFKGKDVNYALSVCFLRQSNFDIEIHHQSQNSPWIALLSYLCSTYYFDKLEIK
jgi:hypothetical protein